MRRGRRDWVVMEGVTILKSGGARQPSGHDLFGPKIAQYSSGKGFLDFDMPRYGFDNAGTGVYP